MNLGLPPPPGVAMPPPPGKLHPTHFPFPLFFGLLVIQGEALHLSPLTYRNLFSPGFGPPMFHTMDPMAPSMPPPMGMRPPGQVHYPSQDPQRMGAHASRHGGP